MSNDDKQLKATVELLLNNAKNRDAASHSLGFLFPKIQNFLGGFGGNFTREDAVLQRRISHRDVAPFYFDFGTQGINWGRVELENVLRSEDPARVLSDAMKKIAESPASDGIRLRRQLLEALENGFKNRTPQLTIDWFNAVVRESPHFLRAKDFAPQFLHRVSNDDRLRWALYRPMQEMSAGERANLLAGSIDVADDISLLCDL